MVKKKSRWQHFGEQHRWQKKRVVVLWTLLVVGGVALAGLSFQVQRFLNRAVWDGQNRLNLVLVNDSVLVMTYFPEEKSVFFLALPGETAVEAIWGYGSYRVAALYDLGEIDGRGGGELLAKSLEEYLGVPIDGFWRGQNLKAEKKSLLAGLGQLSQSKEETNLAAWDRWRLWGQWQKVRADKFRVINIDPQRLDQITGQFFRDQKLASEDLTVAVLNGTNHPGLATRAARLLANIGGRVVNIDDWSEAQTRCQIWGEKNLQQSYTAQKLIAIFGCQWHGEKLEEERADLTLILGEAYWSKLMLR